MRHSQGDRWDLARKGATSAVISNDAGNTGVLFGPCRSGIATRITYRHRMHGSSGCGLVFADPVKKIKIGSAYTADHIHIEKMCQTQHQQD